MSVKFDFSSLETGFEALWPVKVYVPQDGGTHAEQTFTARFRHVSIEAMNDAIKAANEDDSFTYRTLPSLYFVGLGPDEPTWSETLRDQMLATAWVRDGLKRAYDEFASGGAASKN